MQNACQAFRLWFDESGSFDSEDVAIETDTQVALLSREAAGGLVGWLVVCEKVL